MNTTDKHNSVSETRAKCHKSAFCARDDETVTDSDNVKVGTCEHDHSKDVCAESVLDNTSFSYAIGNNTLSNTSAISDDTQNEQVCFDDDSNVSRFSLATWNVGGLLSKLDTPEFVSYVASFDFISLCETFVETFQSSLFPEHTLFCCPALKLSSQGRRSGGVVVLIRNKLLPLVRQLDCKHDNMLLFVIDKECFGLLKDVLLICVYVPPTGSPYYNVTGTDNGIGILEECLAEVQLSSDVHVLLCGDLTSSGKRERERAITAINALCITTVPSLEKLSPPSTINQFNLVSQQNKKEKNTVINVFYFCNGVEWSKDRTQAAESIKWRPQQAYGSNQVLFAQPQTIFSTPKILTRTHR